MKYFTPEWWSLDVEDITVAMEAYKRYIDSIRPKLTPDMVALVCAVSHELLIEVHHFSRADHAAPRHVGQRRA
jgi:hypothetical protein